MKRKRAAKSKRNTLHAPVRKPVGTKDRMGEGPLPISIPGMVVLNSKPRGGKSHMIRYQIYMNRNIFSHGIAFSKSAFRPENLDYMPKFHDGSDDDFYDFKHIRYSEEKLRAFLDYQASFPDNERPVGFVIIDDEISSPGMWMSEAIIDAATMYRHYNIVLFIATQFVNRICTTIRECASQVGLFKMDSMRGINAAYESYGTEFDNYDQFRVWLNRNTTPIEKHQCCWKDKMYDQPWRIVRCPAKIPKFRLIYGQKKCKKPAPKRRRAKAIPLGPFARNAAEVFAGAVRQARGGNPVEDSLSYYPKQISA